MDKETFVHALISLEQQLKDDVEFSEHLGRAFTSAFTANLMPNNKLIDTLMYVLSKSVGDEDKIVEWYCYETDFGKDKDMYVHFNGKKINISSPEELYDFIKGI